MIHRAGEFHLFVIDANGQNMDMAFEYACEIRPTLSHSRGSGRCLGGYVGPHCRRVQTHVFEGMRGQKAATAKCG